MCSIVTLFVSPCAYPVSASYACRHGEVTLTPVCIAINVFRHLVLPERPQQGTDGWDEARLAGLVTRDAMIGVAKIRDPL